MVKSLKQTVREYYKEIFFEASSDFQEWTAPENVTSIHVTAVGAKGYWYFSRDNHNHGGYGGKVECDLEVTPGQTYYFMVGKIPSTSNIAEYNASDIRTDNTGVTDNTSLLSRLVVAGGGGNGSDDGSRRWGDVGGAGGGLTGGTGGNYSYGSPGGGGTQTSGGAGGTGTGGTNGTSGGFGLGGNGSYYSGQSAGGAGWYGGGSGGVGGHNSIWYWHGGGGGSSYTDATLCSNVVHTQGANADGDGYIKIKYLSTKDDYTEVITKGVEYKGIYRSNVRRYFKDIVFEASNSIQEWTVPSKTKSIHVQVFGGQGASSEIDPGDTIGGKGGKVECDLAVTPGQTLYIVAGKIPANAATVTYNASDIRTNNAGITNTTSLQSRVIVAGGGGSGAWRRGSGNGGAGGGLTGSAGVSATYASGGAGGSQSSGGTGGTVNIGGSRWGSPGGNGSLGLGGTSNNHSYQYAIGGVGGAGYYGGGAGAGVHNSNINNAAGGGGGSSYTDPTLCTNVIHTQGANEGNGYVIITLPGTSTDYTRYEDLGPECKLWSNYTGIYKQIELEKEEGTYTLTVNPTPSDATVVLTGTDGTQSGNSITVRANTLATYEASKVNYETKTNSIYMNADKTINVSLRKYCTLTINSTPSDATVTFTVGDVEIEDTTITVIEGTEVTYTVSKTGYVTQNNTMTVNSDQTITVSLVGDYATLTINPTPSDATVALTSTGATQSGNSISVLKGSSVTYTVSKTGYTTQTDTVTVNDTQTINITLQESTPSGTVIFESSTPGTYTVNIPITGTYNIYLVGGGSGSSVHNGGGYGGGSGAYVNGEIQINAGSYTVVVGAGGLGNVTGNTGRAGGDTTFNSNVAGGGKAHATNRIGGGGEYTIVSSGLSGTNGNSGKQNSNYTSSSYINSWDTGGASLYNGYGAGGTTTSHHGEYGADGYIKIVKA